MCFSQLCWDDLEFLLIKRVKKKRNSLLVLIDQFLIVQSVVKYWHMKIVFVKFLLNLCLIWNKRKSEMLKLFFGFLFGKTYTHTHTYAPINQHS